MPGNCYKHFNPNNKALIRSDNKGYLIVPIFDHNFLNGVFVIDTNDPNDLIILDNNKDLHKEIFNWIGTEPILLTLIWRLSNGN